MIKNERIIYFNINLCTFCLLYLLFEYIYLPFKYFILLFGQLNYISDVNFTVE
jgi:hypothetical protein